ncbi:C1-like protein [Corchorus olitorius]|uniref:C1-like protein n=1 Tax=Corchorus olitorius TaxID=93759 RepID=A0A1R3J7J7_9ROSI|nr:C1-like protein [Corchorus olitorius]
MEGEKEIDGVLQLKHRFHEHALTWVDINPSEEKAGGAYCKGCGQVVSGPCFSCANSDCNYHLHKKCAHAPYVIDNHPLHLEHPGFRFSLREGPTNDYREYGCAFCKEKNNVGENFYHSKDEARRLPFFLFANHKDKLIKTVACSGCHEPLADSTHIYVSAECKFHLHKSCFDELPPQIDHPCHRIHPLILEFDNKNRFCKLCQKGDDHDDKNFFYYHCFACNFDIHLECIWPRPVIKDHKIRYHEHPFTLLWRQDSFTCDACGTNGNFASYVCSTCHIHVHEKCVSLPHTIKISRHDHTLSHKYFFNKYKKLEHDCQVCFGDVKAKYGNYHCLKADCSYVAHVECAIGNPRLYDVIHEDENVGDEDMEDCSSFRVIDGDATKIRHFLHDEDEDEHDLVLVLDQMKRQEDSRRCCDGCVVSISGSADPFYYSCLKCDFLLHKGCAEFPKKKRHWYHRFLTTLHSVKGSFFYCCLCHHWCTGFYYQSEDQIYGGKMKLCLRGHCNACGRNIGRYGAFRCKDCSFMLDFACVTLPPLVENKTVCDQHLLQLMITYNCTQESKSEQAYSLCEICETKRDPKHWYYHCAICDTSAHPNCVLGQHPFIKTETPYYWDHCKNRHRLSFARKKIYECPPQCSRCPFCANNGSKENWVIQQQALGKTSLAHQAATTQIFQSLQPSQGIIYSSWFAFLFSF